MSGPNTFMADAKREEFRKYLEKNGVMDILTKSLAVMYAEPEKPADPLKFLTGLMGRAQTGQPTIDALSSELMELRAENLRYKQENEELKGQIENLRSKDQSTLMNDEVQKR